MKSCVICVLVGTTFRKKIDCIIGERNSIGKYNVTNFINTKTDEHTPFDSDIFQNRKYNLHAQE